MTPDIKHIIVPIDFSSNSAKALDYAHGLAVRFGASLHLLHVCEVPALSTGSMDAYAVAYTDWSQQLGAEAERQLLKAAEPLKDVHVTTEILFGNPARAIVTAAGTRECDLIVMGTHGHGPIMHVLMGNVAERVVRQSPCPVLTVRERPAEEKQKVPVKDAGLAAAILVCALLGPAAFAVPAAAQDPPAAGPAQTRQIIAGGELFRTYCVACHGPAARGDGPLAANMVRKPPDLSKLAEKNGGQFPSEIVYRAIDGKQPVRGHGGPDMPVWGDAFMRSRDGGSKETVRETILAIVDYLATLQVKPVH